MTSDFAPAVYLMASARNGTTYSGITSNLMQRIAQRRAGTFEGFAKKHDCKTLVWFEMHSTMEYAITREKQVKKWNRAWKLRLIEEGNPKWRDLAEDLGFEPLG